MRYHLAATLITGLFLAAIGKVIAQSSESQREIGGKLMAQSQVIPAMTSWAVSILNDQTTYPMYSTTTQTFGVLTVLARVEWHPPDFQNSAIHRGVTLYVPG